MATKLEAVLTGVKSLSVEDRAKLRKILDEGVVRGVLAEDALAKALQVNMGPVSGSCPCCGK